MFDDEDKDDDHDDDEKGVMMMMMMMMMTMTVMFSPGNRQKQNSCQAGRLPRLFYLEVHIFVSGGFLNLGDCRLSALLVPADHVKGRAPLGEVLMDPGERRALVEARNGLTIMHCTACYSWRPPRKM